MLEGLSAFLPCYNEERNIVAVLDSARKVLPGIAKDFEIIVVDDGSRDRTAALVEKIMLEDSHVRLVRHERNQGYGATLQSGFRAARLPWVFFTDADGQFDLADFPALAARAADADIVAGYRIRRADPWYRLLNTSIYAFSLRLLMGLSVRDVNCAFKLYRREILDRIPLRTTGALINAEILCRAQSMGCRIVSVGVTHRARMAGVPTGAKPRVILKAIAEFGMLYFEMSKARFRVRRGDNT